MNKKQWSGHPPRGVTLMEVMVTLLILAGGLLALARFQITVASSDSLAKQRTEATLLAQQRMEALRSYSQMSGYAAIASGTDSVTGTSANYSRSWSVVAHTTDPVYKEVTVTVSWEDSTGASQSISVSSNIASSNPALAGQLIINTTSSTATSSTSSSSSSTSSSSSSSTSTTTNTAPTTSTTSTTTSTRIPVSTTTTQCRTTIEVEAQNKNSSVSCSPAESCSCTPTNDDKKSTCTSTAPMNSTIEVTGKRSCTRTANCGSAASC